MQDYKNILIVRTDRIGDVVLTSPCFKIIKDNFSNAKLTVLVSPATKDLVVSNPFVNEVLIDDRESVNAGFLGFIKLVLNLRKRNFDLAIIFHTKKRTNFTCFMAGIPHRVGYKNDKFGFLLNDPIADKRHLGQQHEMDYCIDVLRHLKLNIGFPQLYVPENEATKEWADNWVSNNISNKNKIIAIHLGASDPAKMWPNDKFIFVIKNLIDKYSANIILIGGSNIYRQSGEVELKFNKNINNLVGKTTIAQTVSIIKHCDLLLSNDSGPVHIAAGLKIPVVALFTRNSAGINPERWKPIGQNNKCVLVSQKNMTLPESQVLDVKEVLEAVDSIFKL